MRSPSSRHPRLFHKVLLVPLLVLVIISSAAYWFVSRSFPQTDGTIELTGIQKRVHVIRDQAGVPHIFAADADDLFFAQGYVQAQDRLWQMELNRHIGHGQLAELFGDTAFGESTTLKTDRFLRTIGLDRAARADLKALDPKTRRYLQDFADGVNAFIHSHPANLPLEFMLLGYSPSDWQPLDTLVFGKVLALEDGDNYSMELARMRLGSHLTGDRIAQLIPTYPSAGPFIIPPEVKRFSAGPAHTTQAQLQVEFGRTDTDELAAIRHSLGIREGNGSNNWVVDGTRTSSGKPLLANDPHLGIQMPSIWYTNALQCQPVSAECPYEVSGFSFPGSPGVVIGRNERMAWGVTNTGQDVQDLFLERVNPDNPNQYFYKGQWQDVTVEHEVIHVKNGADDTLDVQITHHGPILTSVLKGVTAKLALEWTATHEVGQLLESVLSIDRAKNWEEFRAALELWDAPAQNFVYADIDGNIGYQMPGRVPIRRAGDGTVVVDGSSGDFEWMGFVPFDELPSVYNPSSHFIASANNEPIPADYRYLLTRDYAAPFRARRITDLITSSGNKLTSLDFARFQSDVYSIPLVHLQSYLVGLKPTEFLGRRALKYVREWNGNLTPETIGGTILEVTYLKLVRDLFTPYLGSDLGFYLELGDSHRLAVDDWLDDPTNSWWDDPTSSVRESRDDRLTRAYLEAVDWLGSQFGDWPPDWHWSRLHQATFAHPFGSVKPLDLLFNIGPVSMSGDGFTVDKSGFDDATPYQVQTISSMRQIVDLSTDRMLWIHSTGQSGQPWTDHYGDLTPLWRDVKFQELSLRRDEVESTKSGELVLVPSSK